MSSDYSYEIDTECKSIIDSGVENAGDEPCFFAMVQTPPGIDETEIHLTLSELIHAIKLIDDIK